MTRKKT